MLRPPGPPKPPCEKFPPRLFGGRLCCEELGWKPGGGSLALPAGGVGSWDLQSGLGDETLACCCASAASLSNRSAKPFCVSWNGSKPKSSTSSSSRKLLLFFKSLSSHPCLCSTSCSALTLLCSETALGVDWVFPVSPSQAASASPGPPSDIGTTWSPGLLVSPAKLELSQSELEQLLDFDLSSSLYLPLYGAFPRSGQVCSLLPCLPQSSPAEEPQCWDRSLTSPPLPPRLWGVGEAGCWREASISSCRAFSYSVCFPCCICSLVKLACSSPSSWRYMQSFLGQLWFFIKWLQYFVVPKEAFRILPSMNMLLTA